MTTADASGERGLTARGLATRERILRRAAEVLLEGGVKAFTLDNVRRAALVSGSQLNHYFTDRQDLLRAVIVRQIDTVLDFHRQPKVGGLDTFEDWERWADLNVRYLRKIGYRGTATYHVLAGQLAKSDDDTRRTFADGYWRWVTLLEDSFSRMRSRGLLVKSADPRHLALVVVSLHQGAGILTFAYRQEWPLVDVTRFVVNYVRLFASDAQERTPRPPRRLRSQPVPAQAHPLPDSGFTKKGLATRARIVEGAAELFLRQGVNGTSLEDVRRALGVSGSQISHYFEDKRDLVRQVIAARRDFVVDFHRRPEMGGLNSLRSLRRWADACWASSGKNYLENGCVYGSLTGELLETDDDILDDLAVGYDRWLELFRDGLSEMAESVDVAKGFDPRHLAVVLVAAHQGGTLLTYITGSAAPFEAAVTAALDYIASLTAERPKSRRRNVAS
ncbi:TetR/AcrR family transcriptional regulator [Mycolicibacterium mageritense]